MANMKSYFLKLKSKIKHTAGRYPAIFFPLYFCLSPSHHKNNLLLRSGIEIVIEGFPRSANTFAVVAFNFSQGRDVPMAHHLHVEAQILRGAELGIPVIALIRHPVDAINSLMVRHPGSIDDYAKRYVEFYSTVLRVADKVVIADFNDVISDFGAVIQRVNKKYLTQYYIFEHSQENMDSVFKKIDQINERTDGGKLTHVARPVVGRQNTVSKLAANDPRIHDAVVLYERLVQSFRS